MLSNPMSHSAKAHWTAEHFDDEWADRLMLIHDKTGLRGVVLFNNKNEITGRMKPL